MKSIKKLLSPNRKDGKKKNAESRRQISPPLDTLPHQRVQSDTHAGIYQDIYNAKMNFTPRTQGGQATLAYTEYGRPDDLTWLFGERDRAERQLYRGPKTKGNKEVQLILREPSIKSVEQFHSACKQAEISARYGIPGEFVYNFSRTFTWNQANATKVSSLQLRDFDTGKRKHKGLFRSTPPTSLPLIDWFDLEAPRTSNSSNGRRLSTISEPGGWRDLSYTDVYEEPGFNLCSSAAVPLDADADDDGWEVEEAEILQMKKMPMWQVRMATMSFPKKRLSIKLPDNQRPR
ncbi:hypothetical protein F4776DRAFT_539435 [Hypoxylon sp. NC0597]|nr:hypothetical protein F4776DRAFT_539435 [Hypoxylon sp. NC0597]